jgi:hypothetical protein
VLHFEVLVFEFATIDRLTPCAGSVGEVTALKEERRREGRRRADVQIKK